MQMEALKIGISCSQSILFNCVEVQLNYILFIHMLQESDNLWWDAFATEFFEDEATLTLTFCLEDGPKRYSKYLFSRNINARAFCRINWRMVLSG
jgi:LIM domain-binding protein 1